MSTIHAFASYDGVSDAIHDSEGISSVVRHSVGLYTFNFTNPIPSGNFAALCSQNAQINNTRRVGSTNIRTTSSVQLSIDDPGTATYGTARANSNYVDLIVVIT